MISTGTATKRECIACGGRTKPSHLPGLVACESCGLISADVDIPDSELMALYGKELAAYLEDQTFGLRARAADGLGAVAETVGSVKEAVETVKTRVEDGFGA